MIAWGEMYREITVIAWGEMYREITVIAWGEMYREITLARLPGEKCTGR